MAWPFRLILLRRTGRTRRVRAVAAFGAQTPKQQPRHGKNAQRAVLRWAYEGGRDWMDWIACRRPLPGYFSFGEFTGIVTRCQPPLERCIGSQFSLCGVGYTGDYCSQCDEDFYRQGNFCLPCVEGEQTTLFAVLGVFLVVLNLCFFLAPYDVAMSFLDLMGHLKFFRAIGM